MNIKYIFVLCLNLFSIAVFGQLFYEKNDTIKVELNGTELTLPWAGGFNNPHFSEIDLNFDGIKDLLVFDKDGRTFKTFINKGTANQVDYVQTHEYDQAFPSCRNFVLMRDFNCDGLEDLFTGAIGGMAVYKNISTPELGLRFELYTSLLMSNYSPNIVNMYVASTDVPAIVDIDNDGDLDVLTFSVFGTTVEYHENIGDCDTLNYKLVTSCWGDFYENSTDNNVTLDVSCKSHTSWNGDTVAFSSASRHSGSTLLAIDLTGNEVKDIILGDVSFNNLVMLTNGGTLTNADMTSQDPTYPDQFPVNLETFPASFYMDVDNDGKKDLLVSPNAVNLSENTKGVWWYKNISTNNVPNFSYQQNDFLQNQMIEVGSGANPVFVDYNQDGLMDIVVGNYGYYDTNGKFKGNLMLLENTGTPTEPAFEIVNTNFANAEALNINSLYPAFGDLDNDGDIDMLIGDLNGQLFYFENIAGNGNTFQFSSPIIHYMNIDVGFNATPFLFDYNKDGKLDLFVGERSGTIKYFENTGTVNTAVFSDTPTNNKFEDIDVMIPCCTGYSNLHIFVNQDNLAEMYVGSEFGYIMRYISADADYNDFVLMDSIPQHAFRVNASLADINQNGKMELLSGQYTGGIGLFFQTIKLRLISPENFATNLNDTLLLDWTSAENIDFYELCVDTTILFNSSLKMEVLNAFIANDDNLSDTEHWLYNLIHGQDYYWKVRTKTGNDFSPWTPTRKFTVSPTGDPINKILSKESLRQHFSIYPNPANNTITILTNEKITLTLYAIVGNNISSWEVNNLDEVDVSFLSEGMYILKTSKGETTKLIIRK
jgi:ribosomal protein L31